MEVDPIDARIKELCDKLVVAQGSEVQTLISELRAALEEHAQYVRYIGLRALSRSSSSAKAAD